MRFDYALVASKLPEIFHALWITLFTWIAGLIGACALGFLVAVGRRYGPRWLDLALGAYVEVFRGTPFLIQLFLIYFGGPYAGLSLDIMLNARDATQKMHAHNLIRFLVANRGRVGFLNMFYQNWGFGQQGPMSPSPGHQNHIHIDWFDPSLAEPSGLGNRKQWTAITWPVAANSSFLSTGEALTGLTAAWNSTAPPFDSNTELYQ